MLPVGVVIRHKQIDPVFLFLFHVTLKSSCENRRCGAVPMKRPTVSLAYSIHLRTATRSRPSVLRAPVLSVLSGPAGGATGYSKPGANWPLCRRTQRAQPLNCCTAGRSPVGVSCGGGGFDSSLGGLTEPDTNHLPHDLLHLTGGVCRHMRAPCLV